MRIVLGFPMEDNQTGVYIKRGIEESGHEVVGINDPRAGKGAFEILQIVDEQQPDFVLINKDYRYNPIIDILSEKCIIVMWNVDVRYDHHEFSENPITKRLYEKVHIKFEIGEGNIEKYRADGVKNIYWLSEAICPFAHKRENLTGADHAQYDYDIAFAGNITSPLQIGRIALMQHLQKTFGDRFKCWTGVFNEEHNKMVQASKINIGHSGWPNVTLSMSARDYRVMGAGGFLLTNAVENIAAWFEVGKMCDVYYSPQDCADKIEYYLKHDKERKEMAGYAHDQMLLRHKFSDRIGEIVDVVERFK